MLIIFFCYKLLATDRMRVVEIIFEVLQKKKLTITELEQKLKEVKCAKS